MSETQPAFTPSPGIPNQAHARFYEALAKETGGPSAPPSVAGQFQTPQTAHHIAMKATEFAKTAAANAPPQAARPAPTVDSIREYNANKGKPAPQVVVDGVDNVAKFDAEMRAKGLQTGADSVAAKDRLIAEYRAAPAAERAKPEWKRNWEARYAAADANGEKPAVEAKPIVPAGTNPNAATVVDSLMKASDAKGFAPVTAFSKDVLSGYSLPVLVKGQTYDAAAVVEQLAAARDAGFSQKQINDYIRADMRKKGFKV